MSESIREDGPAPAARARPLAILGLGVLAMSTSSVLVRLADAPPLVVGAWRLALAWAVITPFALPRARRELPHLDRRQVRLTLLSAVALACHFAAWNTSLSYTSVASSVVLVTTTPIYVALASHFLLGEHISSRKILAIVLALAGSLIIGYGDMGSTSRALLGDALAVLGALAMGAHLMLGQAVRRSLSTLAYVWPVYGVAALLLGGLCFIGDLPLLGYVPRTYLMVFLLALFPQVMGHSIFNWALASLSPLFLTLAILGEPIGASLLAYLILDEIPPTAIVLGGPLILLGIYMASREEGASRAGRASPEMVMPEHHALH